MVIIKILKHYAEGEVTNFIKVWALVFASLTYCFFVSKTLPKGLSRLLTIIPVLILNLILPLSLHTMHLGGSSAFFLVWLANFKLLMLAFGTGPLSDPSISLPRFAAFACLPIKQGLKPFWNYLAKALLICLFLKMYDYTDLVHPKLTWVLYALHIYCGLEIILALFGGLAKALIGVELEAWSRSSTSLISRRRCRNSGEGDGTSWSPPHCVRARVESLHSYHGPEMGPLARDVRHVPGVGLDARTHFLLLGPGEAQRRDHLVFRASRRVFGGEESNQGSVAAAEVNHGPSDDRIRADYGVLVVFPRVFEVRCDCQGFSRVCGDGGVREGY